MPHAWSGVFRPTKGKKMNASKFALAAMLTAFACVSNAQSIQCTNNSDSSICDLTPKRTGRHVLQANATATETGSGATLKVWIEVNGTKCGLEKNSPFSGKGSVFTQCGATLSKGKSYRVDVKTVNVEANPGSTSLTVRPPSDDDGVDLDMR